VEHAEIKSEGTVIGQVNVTSYSAAEDSIATWMFQSSLFKNSLYSIGIVLLLAVITGILVSRRMSRDLVLTSQLAQSADIGEEMQYPTSKVKEIRIIQQSLELLRARLKLKQKSRKALIDELVHQARTPLTILRTHLEGLEDGVIEMGTEEIKICENQIENVTAIITNMSSLIDAESPIKSQKIEEFELGQLLRQIVNGLRAQFDKKNIDLQITGQEKVILTTDKYKLSQTIYNILTNAYKFTPSSGKVTIHYAVAPDRVVLSIEDNGPGIDKADQTKIFDAYYRKDSGEGTTGDGIGLFIAKENMTGINGSISVQSELNKGSKFILTIPR
jgi:signal transduction histidine kinase